MLFIQGLGADKHGWDFQRLGLAWAIHAIALDNRGSGRSDKPHGAYSLDQMADDAIAVLDDAGFRHRARRRRVHGRRHRPLLAALPGASPLADAGVHVLPQPRGAASCWQLGGDRPPPGMGSMTEGGRAGG